MNRLSHQPSIERVRRDRSSAGHESSFSPPS
jgi:hypothetical protein